MMDPDIRLVFFLKENTGTKAPVLQESGYESRRLLFLLPLTSSRVMEDRSQGWHRKKDQLDVLRDVVGWERCFSTWSGAAATNILLSWFSTSPLLPATCASRFLPSLGSAPPDNVALARWTVFLPGDRQHTSACKPLNLNASLQSAPTSVITSGCDAEELQSMDEQNWSPAADPNLRGGRAHTHAPAAHQHSLRHAGETEKTPCSMSEPQPLRAAERNVRKRTCILNANTIFKIMPQRRQICTGTLISEQFPLFFFFAFVGHAGAALLLPAAGNRSDRDVLLLNDCRLIDYRSTNVNQGP